MEDRHLSLSEVAGLMGVSERTVRRWIKSGKLRAYKPGRDYRIPESAVREFVEDSEISPKGLRRLSRHSLTGSRTSGAK
jgi:excisionase family DNA binding protein